MPRYESAAPRQAAALCGKLELVVAHIVPKSRRIVLRSEELFAAGAEVGTERTLTIRCTHPGDQGTVLAVVSWGEDNTKPRAMSIDSVPLRPGRHRLRATLAEPARVEFVEPPGVLPETRPWSQIIASTPRRFMPHVGEFDLLCALDLGDDGFADRRALVSELVELLRQEYPEPGRFRVALVGYRAHDFRANRQVVYGRWLDTPDEAQRSLDRFHAFKPGPTQAAPIEDALDAIARGMHQIPVARRLVLLTLGDRPPHPPEEDGGEISCPHGHDWQTLLSRIEHHPGGQASVAVLDSTKYLGEAWRRLGKTARHQLGTTHPHQLAMSAGLLVPPAQRLAFPLLESQE